MNAERLQVRVFEQLTHQVRGAGAFRADADRRATQIGKGVEGAVSSPEEQQGLRLRQPSKQLEPRISRHRRAVLDKGEHLGAASSTVGQAADVLDRAGSGYDREGPVL